MKSETKTQRSADRVISTNLILAKEPFGQAKISRAYVTPGLVVKMHARWKSEQLLTSI